MLNTLKRNPQVRNTVQVAFHQPHSNFKENERKTETDRQNIKIDIILLYKITTTGAFARHQLPKAFHITLPPIIYRV